jgi:hypothetical protein
MLTGQAGCYYIITGTWQFRVADCLFDDSANRRKFWFLTNQKPRYKQPENTTADLELTQDLKGTNNIMWKRNYFGLWAGI